MPFITLLSDFGLHDPTVAIVKGVFMQHFTDEVIDISHEVGIFNVRQAAYICSTTYKNFPEGTCHVLLFDLFSGSVPRLLLSEFNGHYFLSPDNELLSLALGAIPENTWLCYELSAGNTFIDWLHAAGNIIRQLNTDKYSLKLPRHKLQEGIPVGPFIKPNEILCEVLHTDHYENVVINITKQELEKTANQRPFQLQFMRVEEITEISGNYSMVRAGYKLCRFNSNGYLEICINRGKAASLFGLRAGGKHNDIKIIFE